MGLYKSNSAKEQVLQSRILRDLELSCIWHFKTIRCNRRGIPDIVGILPNGKFFAIEVKAENGKATELQKIELNSITLNKGLCAICYSFENYLDFKKQLLAEIQEV